MRAAIAKLPDGTYTHEFQTDGLEEPFDYKVAVTVAGERISVDYAGTSRAGRPRHQLHDDLHLRHDGLCAQMRAAAEPAQQRGHLPLHRGVGARGLNRQSALPGVRRRAHGDGPLSPVRRVRSACTRSSRTASWRPRARRCGA